MAKKFPADRMADKSLGDVNAKKNKWGGDSDVVRPYNDPKEQSKNSGVDTKVFNKDGTNTIPYVASAAKTSDNKNYTGKLFPEAGTSCDYDGGGDKVSRPYDAGKGR